MTNTEIRKGEYVRLARNQGINKIISSDDDYYVLDEEIADEYGYLTSILYKNQVSEEIINHSFNIIDLIEVGDYVKLYAKLGNKEYIDNISSCVCNVGKSDDKSFIELDYGQDGTEIVYNADSIKSIVTKEQFKAMEYEVGEGR